MEGAADLMALGFAATLGGDSNDRKFYKYIGDIEDQIKANINDKDMIEKIIKTGEEAIVQNPNGGGHIWVTGVFMIYVVITLLLYWTWMIVVSGSRGKIFNKEFMAQFEG